MTQLKLVEVEWEDATNVNEWTEIDEARRFKLNLDFHCRSVGFLIRDDDECVVLAGRVTGDFKSVGMVERIPRGMVQLVTILATREAGPTPASA